MRQILLVLCTLTLAACSSVESINYYQLDGGEFPANKDVNLLNANVIVSAPTLTGHLANRGIAVEVSPLQIQSANNHLWSASPSELLLQASVVSLDQSLPSMRVLPLQLESAITSSLPTYRVDYYINKLQADMAGNGVITGTVTIYQLKHTTAHLVFSEGITQKIALEEDGYSALVQSINRAWLSINHKTASALKALADKG